MRRAEGEETMKTINVKWNGKTAQATADQDGTVRVWDSVAGHYTTCHSLTERQQQLVRSRCK
jgi:hypothetical protein